MSFKYFMQALRDIDIYGSFKTNKLPRVVKLVKSLKIIQFTCYSMSHTSLI